MKITYICILFFTLKSEKLFEICFSFLSAKKILKRMQKDTNQLPSKAVSDKTLYFFTSLSHSQVVCLFVCLFPILLFQCLLSFFISFHENEKSKMQDMANDNGKGRPWETGWSGTAGSRENMALQLFILWSQPLSEIKKIVSVVIS